MPNFQSQIEIVMQVTSEIKKIRDKNEMIQRLPYLLYTLSKYESIAICLVDSILDEFDICYSTLSDKQQADFDRLIYPYSSTHQLSSLHSLLSTEVNHKHVLLLHIPSKSTGIIACLFLSRLLNDYEIDFIEIIRERLETAFHIFSITDTQHAHQQQVIRMLSRTIEVRSPYTRGHSERVAQYAIGISKTMGLSKRELDLINKASLLHDIGKVGVPDSALNKPGKLTTEEYEQIKTHSSEGARILESLGFLQEVIPYVMHHHESYDGSGYPYRLQGDKIPLGAQIISIADAFDALTSDRVYRKGLPRAIAVDELVRCKGAQFSPSIIDAFLESLEKPELLVHSTNTVSLSPNNNMQNHYSKKLIPLLCNKCGIALPYPANEVSKCFVCGEIFDVEQANGKWIFK